MRLQLAAIALCLLNAPSHAEEGFWPFSTLPEERILAELGSLPSAAVLAKVERATMQLGGFCTASLAGPEGLALTNYHCISDCLKDLSDSANDYVINGFKVEGRAGERQCPGLFAERPLTDVDVTDRFKSALKNLTGSTYIDRLNQEIGAATGECQGSDGDRSCKVVQYFNGAAFRLQSFKVYRDVRVVFAPEYASANFGGDLDNFNFPRYGFDMALLRLYENDAPAVADGWLTWRSTPPNDGEPLLVAGYPGFTFRYFTVAQLHSMRDGYLPWYMNQMSELRGRLLQFAEQADGKDRVPSALIYEVENSLKSARGEFETLADDKIMAAKETAEASLRAKIAADPQLSATVGTAFEEIDSAELVYRDLYRKFALRSDLAPSMLLQNAVDLVAAIRQLAKPEEERLPYYVDENLPAINQSLFAEAAIDPELEVLALSFGLSKLQENLGPDHGFVRRVLGKESPGALARRAIAGTRLGDSTERRKLFEGGLAMLAASDDPLLKIAAIVEEEYAALNERYNTDVDAVEALAHQRISLARDAGSNAGRYPDADGSLRLTYGRVSGWSAGDGVIVPSCTLVKDLGERSTDYPPFQLAQSWRKSLARLEGSQPFNCVTTHDVVGGFSGSAAIDMDGRIAGVAFDGNLKSLGGTYLYDGSNNRTIILSAKLIREALEKIYGLEPEVE